MCSEVPFADTSQSAGHLWVRPSLSVLRLHSVSLPSLGSQNQLQALGHRSLQGKMARSNQRADTAPPRPTPPAAAPAKQVLGPRVTCPASADSGTGGLSRGSGFDPCWPLTGQGPGKPPLHGHRGSSEATVATFQQEAPPSTEPR